MIEKMAYKEYKLRNPDKKILVKYGFKYNKATSTSGQEIYVYRFPVHKYKQYVTLECEMSVNITDNKVKINVYKWDTNEEYSPFYANNYGCFEELIKRINNKIKSVFHSINVEEVK